jgi:plastocyanin
MNRGLLLRSGAALAILISGIVHLDLYFNQGYRFASSDVNFGRSILLNSISSGVLAVALVARKEWFVKAAGIGFALSTIVLFVYTHAENSFLGYSHAGPVFEPSPQAEIALIAQIVAIVLLAVSFIPGMETEESTLPMPGVGVAFAIAAIALIGLTVKWQPEDADSISAPPAPEAPAAPIGDATTTTAAASGAPAVATPAAAAVSIAGFKFVAPDLSVPAGSTITWTNNDTAQHSVVADDVSFVSDNLRQGGTFAFTFDTPGTFTYFCGIHANMKGSVTVTP